MKIPELQIYEFSICKVDGDMIIWIYSWCRLLQLRSKAGGLGDIVAVPVGDMINVKRILNC